MNYIADEIEQLILTNDSTELNEWGDTKGRHYSDKTIVEFKNALHFLRLAQIYTQRIDWLVSGDDGEDCFHKRLQNETQEHYNNLEVSNG